jgi:hypothetical protein
MSSCTRLVLLVALQLCVGAALAGCAGSEDRDSTGVLDAGTQPALFPGTLQLTYSPMYSSFVEGHESKLPVMLDPRYRNMGAKFSSSDPAIAVVADTPDGAMITVKREGTVKIRAALAGETGVARLVITKYTEAQWRTGQARYAKQERALNLADGGAMRPPLVVLPPVIDNNGGCNTCHAAEASVYHIEDSPQQTAGYNDRDLITIMTMGRKPEWAQENRNSPSFLWGMNHSWTISAEEEQGLIAFLRTKRPKAMARIVEIDTGPIVCGVASPGSIPPLCDPTSGKPIALPPVTHGIDAGVTPTPDAVPSGDAG